jgi:hypothetical protein
MKKCIKCKIELEDESISMNVYGQITHCPICETELGLPRNHHPN